jgi:leader peptidase (prepilin peptidase)/N-methyltransferase
MFPEWTWLVGLFVGACIGSFLNVVIYRMPRGISLADPPKSFCPECKHSLGVLDLFPLLSWLFLRGKCRYCGNKVSSRYFAVELANGSIWAGIWYQYFVASWDPARGIAYALAAAALVAIIFIDWELYIIPDQINAFLVPVGVGFNVWLYTQGSPEATTLGIPSCLAGWLVGVLALWGIAVLGRLLFRKDAMGHGDIKMARGIGAVLFPAAALISFAMAVVLGAVIGIVFVLIRSRIEAGREADEEEEEDEDDMGPEPIGSLLKCGLGYLLGFDIVGLFVPKFYESWFGEPADPAIEEIDDFNIERTMIPFGPFLALGAIVSTVFAGPLQSAVAAYWDWAVGPAIFLEQFYRISGQII